jgi:hypothetical protein
VTDEQQRLAYRAIDALEQATATIEREKLSHTEPGSRRLAALEDIQGSINKALQALLDIST